MKVAGLGFRATAPLASLVEALGAARAKTDGAPLDALATLSRKAEMPVMRALGARLGLPVIGVDIDGQATPSRSARIEASFGTGSVAEAAALAAAGPAARVTATRVQSADGMAVAAIAETEGSRE